MEELEPYVNQTNEQVMSQDTHLRRLRWLSWILLSLIIIGFIILIIVLRGLCTDEWYVRFLGLSDRLCQSSSMGSSKSTQQLSLSGNTLTISDGNSIVLPVSEVPLTTTGASGLNGSAGATGLQGATGSTGPAGPVEPCSIMNTYFCQGGNSFGTTAQLGTNDTQDLQIITAGTSAQLVDAMGNVVTNKLVTIGSLPTATFTNSYSNEVMPGNILNPVATTTFTDSNLNRLYTESSNISGSSGNLGWVVNSTLSDTELNLLAAIGASIQGGNGLVGQFIGVTVTDSNNLIGQFGDGLGGSSITSSSNIMGSSAGISPISNSNHLLVDLNASSLTDSTRGIASLSGVTASDITQSVVIDNSATLNSVTYSLVNGSAINATNIYATALVGSDINATDLTRVAATGVGVTLDTLVNTNVTGFAISVSDTSWANINSFDTSLTNGAWINFIGHGSTIDTLFDFTGEINNSTIDHFQFGNALIANSTVTDSSGFVALVNRANVNNVTNLYGAFGGYCQSTDPLGPYYCSNGYDIKFDIIDSDALVGTTHWTNIHGAQGNFFNLSATDPLVFSSTVTNVDNSFLQGRDVTFSEVSRSIVLGNNQDIQNLASTIAIGSNLTLDGLTNSILMGSNVSLTDTGDNDYSFLGSNAGGNINTRINSNGYDSWLNLAGGKVGLGTNTPANKLDVTDTTDDTPASFTGTSGTCTVDTNAGSLSCVSDQKLKTNILSINNGLDIINQLQGVTYNWRVNPDGSQVAGFIAQDVAKVLPNLVTTLPDGTLTLNKEGIMPYIVEAVKQQNGNIDKANQQLTDQGVQLSSISDQLKIIVERLDSNDKKLLDQQQQIDDLKAEVKQLKQTSVPATTLTP